MEKKLLKKLVRNFIITGTILNVIFALMLYQRETWLVKNNIDYMLDQVEVAYEKSDEFIEEILIRTPTPTGSELFVVNTETAEMLGATCDEKKLLNIRNIDTSERFLKLMYQVENGRMVKIDGSYKYVKSRDLGNVIMGGYIESSSYLRQIFFQMLFFMIALGIILALMHHMIRKQFQICVFEEFKIIEKSVVGLLTGEQKGELYSGDNTEIRAVEAMLNSWRDKMSNDLKDATTASEKDSLTGLCNRYGFEKQAGTQQRKFPNRGAMLMIDVDNFKKVNDNMGHPEGDKVLKIIADVLAAEFRADDVVARLGGDEYAVYMKNRISAEVLEKKVQEVLEKVRESIEYYHEKLNVSVSIGAACVQDKEAFYDELYKYADKALYEAKESGKNGYVMKKI